MAEEIAVVISRNRNGRAEHQRLEEALIDRLMKRSGVQRPFRAFIPHGGYPDGVEFRAVRSGGGYLAYLANTTLEPREVVVAGLVRTIHNISTGVDQKDEKITLAPLETRIMRITPVRGK